MSSTLAGQTILVVGGTSGIGFAVANASLLSGARHVIVASSSPERVQLAVSRLQDTAAAAVHAGTLAEAGTIAGEVLDAKDLGALRAFCERVGEVDHLIWTAGDHSAFTLPKEVEASKDFMNLRVWSPLQAARSIRIRNGGSVTLSTGTIHKCPPPGFAVFAVVGAAIEGLGRGLAAELAPIRVNVVSLGFIATELTDKWPKEMRDNVVEDVEKKSLVRHVAMADEAAEAYLYLMKCKNVSGTTIEVDGGRIIVQ